MLLNFDIVFILIFVSISLKSRLLCFLQIPSLCCFLFRSCSSKDDFTDVNLSSNRTFSIFEYTSNMLTWNVIETLVYVNIFGPIFHKKEKKRVSTNIFVIFVKHLPVLKNRERLHDSYIRPDHVMFLLIIVKKEIIFQTNFLINIM